MMLNITLIKSKIKSKINYTLAWTIRFYIITSFLFVLVVQKMYFWKL